jgi:hypothetical protein
MENRLDLIELYEKYREPSAILATFRCNTQAFPELEKRFFQKFSLGAPPPYYVVAPDFITNFSL